MERVNLYIDGFNLYFGMLEGGLGQCKWLDVMMLSQRLLKPEQALGDVYYFTSRVSNNSDKQKRQTTYLEAIETRGVRIIYGHYQRARIDCNRCGHTWNDFNEKMTDVNIATSLIADAIGK